MMGVIGRQNKSMGSAINRVKVWGASIKGIISEKEKPCGISLTLRERSKCRMIQLVNMDVEVGGKLNMPEGADLDFLKKTGVCWIFEASY